MLSDHKQDTSHPAGEVHAHQGKSPTGSALGSRAIRHLVGSFCAPPGDSPCSLADLRNRRSDHHSIRTTGSFGLETRPLAPGIGTQ